MEDAHITIPNLGDELEGVGLFAVFDGHGGREVARFCQEYLPKYIKESAGKSQLDKIIENAYYKYL